MTILMEIALKSFLVLAVAGMTTLALRRAAASTRHLVWTLAVLTVLLLPAAVLVLPRQPLAVDGSSVLAALVRDAGVAAGNRPMPEAPDADPAPRAVIPAIEKGAPAGDPEIPLRVELPSADVFVRPTAAETSSPLREPAAGERVRLTAGSATTGSEVEPPVEDAGGDGADIRGRGSLGSMTVGLLTGALWLLGVGLVVFVFVIERARVHNLGRRAVRGAPGSVTRTLQRVCRDAGLRRRPRLRLGEARSMPMTWGTLRPVVLLPAEAASWSAARLEAVLRHEVAHIRRYDDLTQVVATLVAALHWFDPLVWVALRQLRVERELACDDAVLRLGARPSGYAEELLRIADEFRSPPAGGLAALPMARRSQLHRRLQSVLEEARSREAVTPARALVGVAAAAALALPLSAFGLVVAPATENSPPPTPAVEKPAIEKPEGENPAVETTTVGTSAPQTSECWSPGIDHSSRSITDTDLRVLEWESAGCRADLRLQGELSFNEDFTEVVGISAAGSFVLEHEENGTRRRLELRPAAGGMLQWIWRLDGREQPYDAQARQWFSEMLLPILRASGIAAEERAAWIYRQRGTDGVLDEVSMMYGNGTRARYLRALLQQEGLDDDDLEKVVDTVRTGIGSNSAKGRVLQTLGTRYTERIVGGPVEQGYWDAVASIESNSTTSRLLIGLVEGQPQDAPIVARTIRSAAANIHSNSTLASFLRRLQRQYPNIAAGGPNATLFWETATRIDSNSTMRGFLLDISEGTPIDDPDLLPIIFDTAQARISSNSTRADFIRTMARRYPGIGETGPMRDEFWATVDRVSSPSTLSALLLDLASGEPSDSEMLDLVLDRGRRLTSSSQRGRFLVSFASDHPDAAAGRLADELLEAARGIGSRSTRERTLRALEDLGIG